MTLSRRDFLKLTGLVASSAALAACSPSIFQRVAGKPALLGWAPLPGADFLALNRLTFGPRPEERARFEQVGLQAWVEEQLAFESIDDFACNLRLQSFDTLNMKAHELADLSDKIFDDIDLQSVPDELRQATLVRQVYSRRQLFEVVAEFWSDHFNIATVKGNCFYLKTVDDREVIRKHALGSFRDLLWASAHSSAMLTYLDNQVNHKGAPNENYARELMELHTLGVHGGYSQQDVMELARCLTGWTVKEHFWTGDFSFDDGLHDTGEKFVLGARIPAGGQDEAESVVEALAKHPSTAQFVATKLARRFLSDPPPEEIVRRAAAAFTQTNGDIRATLRVVLLDGLVLAQPRYKRPVNFVAASLRMLGVDSDGGPAVQDYLLRMGQRAFNWPTPDGYPDRDAAWQGNLMPRWQFAFGLVRGELENTSIDLDGLREVSGAKNLPESIDAIASLLLGAPLASAQRDAWIASVQSAGASEDETLAVLTGGILASPAFQWR
jgi:uncharacterized protein (DUF1800 family)